MINDVAGINQIKIIDFGFATNCGPDVKLSMFCGTPCYMDPDLTRDKKYYGQAVDVWACGVILFLMLNGQLPFYSDNQQDLSRKIQNAKYSIPPNRQVSKAARDLIAKMF